MSSSRAARREFLERSLADLDAELASGDLAVEDHRRLRADYEARLAALDIPRSASRTAPGQTNDPPAPRRGRTLATVTFVVVVAAAAGVLLAGAVGRRGTGDNITGIDLSPNEPAVTVTTLPTALQACFDLTGTEALDCYVEYTRAHPDDAQGFLYFGLFSVNQGLQGRSQELLDAGRSFLERALEIDPGQLQARANLAVVLERTGDAAAAREVLAPLLGRDDLPTDVRQLVEFVQGNLAEDATSTTGAPATTAPP